MIGHWEGDTVVGRNQRGFLVPLVERRSGFSLAGKVATNSAAEVAAAVVAMLAPYRPMVRTLTFNNGTEFARHVTISESLGCRVYLAKPYASWQRGSNGDFNGLLRQYFPKRFCLARVRPDHVAEVERRLNARARKRFDWETPPNIFGAAAKCLGVALAS